MKKSTRKKAGYIFHVSVILVITALILYFMFRGDDAKRIICHLKKARKPWIVLGAALMLVFIFIESVQLKVMFDGMKQKISWWRCFLLSNVEYFFAQITPGAAGGQPIQMIYMTRFGVDVLVGALACMMIAVWYKAAFLTIFIIALIFRPNLVLSSIRRVPILFSIGVLFQLISVFFLWIGIFRPKAATALVGKIIGLGAKLHIVKNPEAANRKAQASISMYHYGSGYLRDNKMVVFRMFLYTVVQRLAYFSVTFCVAKALGVGHVDWLSVVAVQAILSLSVDMLPIPGAAGANELVFVNLQRKLFTPALMGAGLLLNRGITYYFLMISCGIFTILANFSFTREREAEEFPEKPPKENLTVAEEKVEAEFERAIAKTEELLQSDPANRANNHWKKDPEDRANL
ncbi:MAG: flippase-like domain-containing protein [Lachnospiraceae bacterium]|nr:flippase-like domain-containing protein [Lachnospiraceae bacterium]